MARGDDIEERLVDFAVRIINLTACLPKTMAGNHIGSQLIRGGTAPAAHYAEARVSESERDFVHKIRIGLKELNETRAWLKITSRSEMLSENRLKEIYKECDELCRILNASIQTIRKRNH